jgi:hypothetical protein
LLDERNAQRGRSYFLKRAASQRPFLLSLRLLRPVFTFVLESGFLDATLPGFFELEEPHFEPFDLQEHIIYASPAAKVPEKRQRR